MLRVVFFVVVLFWVSSSGLALAQSWQAIPISPECPTGSAEAEELYQTARKYNEGAKGMPYDLKQAEALYQEAMEKGNAKAAIKLGLMYRINYASRPDRAGRHEYMIGLFEYAQHLGCPEAYQALAEAYGEGWG